MLSVNQVSNTNTVLCLQWVQWSWLIIHWSWPFIPPWQQPWPWTGSHCHTDTLSTLHIQQQLTFLASMTYYLCTHSRYCKHSNPLWGDWGEVWPHVPPDITPKYHNNDGDRFFTGTDLVYDLQGQRKFFAMGSFVNWAEIWWMYVGVGVGVGLHIIDLVRRVNRKKQS